MLTAPMGSNHYHRHGASLTTKYYNHQIQALDITGASGVQSLAPLLPPSEFSHSYPNDSSPNTEHRCQVRTRIALSSLVPMGESENAQQPWSTRSVIPKHRDSNTLDSLSHPHRYFLQFRYRTALLDGSKWVIHVIHVSIAEKPT
jgi:hypothetical protein